MLLSVSISLADSCGVRKATAGVKQCQSHRPTEKWKQALQPWLDAACHNVYQIRKKACRGHILYVKVSDKANEKANEKERLMVNKGT